MMKTEVLHFLPKNLDELDRTLSRQKAKVTFVAGATDLMVQENKWQAAECLISLEGVREVRHTLKIRKDGVRIGAALPLGEIINHPVILEKLPMLVETCRQIGSVQIQNRATLGGNIANASPAGDTLPVLAVLNAEIWIGPRRNGQFIRLSLPEVMTGPGKTCLGGNRYIAFIYLPFPGEEHVFWYFRKVGPRYSMAISKVSLAVLGWIQGEIFSEIRICAGSVTPLIKRATQTEQTLISQKLSDKRIDQAVGKIAREITPISDIRSTADYRRDTCQALLREALHLARSHPNQPGYRHP